MLRESSLPPMSRRLLKSRKSRSSSSGASTSLCLCFLSRSRTVASE
jgi:hypothetical protein